VADKTYKSEACHQTHSSAYDARVLRLLIAHMSLLFLQFKWLLTLVLIFGNEELLLFIALTQHIAYLTSRLTCCIAV
jgi:hypothetical protein